MNFIQFNSLKIGDRCYIPNANRKDMFISTEVLKIDRFFKKVTVLLGKKSYSYKYIRSNINSSKISYMVGTYK